MAARPPASLTLSLTIDEPGDPSPLHVRGARVAEGLSRLSEVDIEVLSGNSKLSAEDFLGRAGRLDVAVLGKGQRTFEGFVVRMARGGTVGRFFSYFLTLRPGLWFLGRRTDCKVFQNTAVPNLVATLIKEGHPFVQVQNKLTRKTYRKWEYCVQYEESDLDFVERLLAHEGIRYRFVREKGQSLMRLEDEHDVRDASDAIGTIQFASGDAKPSPGRIQITGWSHQSTVESASHAEVHFDELKPRPLPASSTAKLGIPKGDRERFSYPSEYMTEADHKEFGERQTRDRLQEAQVFQQVAHGTSNSPDLAPGRFFVLSGHPDRAQNTEHLLVTVIYDLEQVVAQGDQILGTQRLEASFTAIPAVRPFRPPRGTAKPRILGPQTAVVVTEKDEEITVDEHGRIKIQFHWDRKGENDERSSCFVRVAQIWAGNGYGAMFIPRKGHEVVVSFLDGDPDRPLVTGCVYNGEHRPPWGTKDTKTQSGIKTQSTKSGNVKTANHIRFEDKKGAEQFDLHAERTMAITVEADQSVSVGHDQSEGIGHNRQVTVGKHDTLTVKGGRTVSVTAGGEYHTVVGGRSMEVKGNESRKILEGNEVVEVAKTYQFKSANQLVFTGAVAWHSAENIFTNASVGHNLYGKKIDVVAAADHTEEAGGTRAAKAAEFKWTSPGNFSFLGKDFNRTVMSSNDTILGQNNSAFLGMSRSMSVAFNESIFLGLGVEATLGIKSSTFLGMNVENTLALKISNCAGVSIETSAMKNYQSALQNYMPGGVATGAVQAADVAGKTFSIVAALVSAAALGGSVWAAYKGMKELIDAYEGAAKAAKEAKLKELQKAAEGKLDPTTWIETGPPAPPSIVPDPAAKPLPGNGSPGGKGP